MNAADDGARLAALGEYDILDSPAEAGFDDIAGLAAAFCAAPIALVSLVDADRQWFKAEHGLRRRETPIDQSVCAVAIRHGEVFIVPDLRADPRFAANPLVTAADGLRFYAGARLDSAAGVPIGMLCVLDRVPRPEGLDPAAQAALRALARQVMAQLELRRALRQRDRALVEHADAEARRAAQERHSRRILDSAIDYAIVTFDLDGLTTSWNRGACRILGWTEAEMLGHPAARFFTPEDVAAGVPEHEMAMARQVGHGNDERWHIRRDGTRFWASGEMMALTEPDGAVTGFLKILRDRTSIRAQSEALRAADDRLALALDAGAVIGSWIWDIPGRSIEIDRDLARLLGLAPGALPAPVADAALRAALHPQDREAFLSARARGVAKGGPFRLEYRLLIDGRLIWVEASGRVDHDPSGAPLRCPGVLIDVTERRMAEAERERLMADLDAERFRLRALLDSLPVGVAFAEAPSGRIVLANPQVERILRHPVLDEPGRPAPAWTTTHSDGRKLDPAEVPVTRAIAEGRPTGAGQYRYRRGDGIDTWVELSAAPMQDAAGTVTGAVLSVVDVGDKVIIEQALRSLNETLETRVAERTRQLSASEARFRALIDNAPDMIFLGRVGPGDRVVFQMVNAAAQRFLGLADLSAAGRPGRPSLAMLPAAAQTHLRARCAACVETGATLRFEERMERPGGARVVDVTLVPMAAERPGQAGHLVLGTARDITAQRDIEEALRQSQKMEAVGQLTGGLAHDFNNLLAGIVGSLELMRNRIAQGRIAELDRFVAAATSSATRAAALTHRLLAFSRRQTLDPRPTDVARLVDGMQELIARSIGPEIGLRAVMADGLWTVLCDPAQLDGVLLNLALNARDAMPDGGQLVIEAVNATLSADQAQAREVTPGQYVAISVVDTGTGMTPEVMARVFDPFFTTKPLGRGTGLGLSMVYGFARQSGGHVQIESEPHHGTAVRLFLPRSLEQPGEAAQEAAPAALTRAPANTTVLVVDDERVVRMLVMEALEELGYGAIEAEDGPEGLRILSTNAQIDLLVSDVGLPGGINGRQLADAARVLRPGLKVLFITGYAETAAIGERVLAPGMAVMTKPFEMEALAARIREMVDPRIRNTVDPRIGTPVDR